MKKALFAITMTAAFALAYIEHVPEDETAYYRWKCYPKKCHRDYAPTDDTPEATIAGYRWHQKRWDYLEPVVG